MHAAASIAAGLIPDVLDSFPEATVAGSKVALAYLQSLTHRPFKQQPVKGGDKIDLGGGHELEFVMAPNLHWPDTMFSFDHATGPAPCCLGLALAVALAACCCVLSQLACNSVTVLQRLCTHPGPVAYSYLISAALGSLQGVCELRPVHCCKTGNKRPCLL